MLYIALSLLIHSLWLIFSPLTQRATILLSAILVGIIALFSLFKLFRSLGKKSGMSSREILQLFQLLFLFIGIFLSYSTLYPRLLSDRAARSLLPLQDEIEFKVTRNHPAYNSIDIEILRVKNIAPENRSYPLIQKQIRIYERTPAIREALKVGGIYRAEISINIRDSRNFPGNLYQRLQLLLYHSIGNGKFKDPTNITLIQPPNFIENTRQAIETKLLKDYKQGRLMAALSVGKNAALTQLDWQILRQTGTIHLVSISGLHLSFTAFWGFLILKSFLGILGVRRIPPYKIAALISIVIAWAYALLAGMTLPTERAAIMFTVAMITHLIGRPIFSFQSLSIALIIILLRAPLSLLSAGFWLSFTALAILILVSRITLRPIALLVISQLAVSLFLMPLSQSFFGEVSLISPLINLLAIPLTTLYILPTLMLGLFTAIFPGLSNISTALLGLSDHLLALFIFLIEQSAALPLASLELPKYSLPLSLIITTLLLLLLAILPRIHLSIGMSHWITPIILLSATLLIGTLPVTLPTIKKEIHKSLFSPGKRENSSLKIWLFPVGEGLSALLYTPETQEAILFDTGNYFRGFDAGRSVILPALKALNIDALNTLILSIDNQQHRGGTRSIRAQFPNAALVSHPTLLPFSGGQNCQSNAHLIGDFILIPIPEIRKSCAYSLHYAPTIRKEQSYALQHTYALNSTAITKAIDSPILAWIISDPEPYEWEQLLKRVRQQSSPFTPPKVILYPNQGRSRYFARFTPEEIARGEPIFLYSTRQVSPNSTYQSNRHTPLLNAYHGAIAITLNIAEQKLNQNRLQYTYTMTYLHNSLRFWWADMATKKE